MGDTLTSTDLGVKELIAQNKQLIEQNKAFMDALKNIPELRRILSAHRSQSPVSVNPDQQAQQAHDIVTRFVWLSAGSGIIPFPVLDTIALTTLQVMMLRELCRVYGIEFRKDWGKELIGALVGGLTPAYLKSIPGIGSLIGILTSPAFNAASTYAVGKVFIQHFSSGGTMLDFNPKEMLDHYKKLFETAARPGTSGVADAAAN